MSDATDLDVQPVEARPPLGPGDSDGKPAVGQADPALPPPGPGDATREARPMPPAVAPLGPGESDGKNPEDGTYRTLAPAPAGPGEVAVSRSVVRFPIGADAPQKE